MYLLDGINGKYLVYSEYTKIIKRCCVLYVNSSMNKVLDFFR